MSLLALCVALVSLAILGASALGFWGTLALALRSSPPATGTPAPGSIDVVVPARDEGERILACVQSLLAQDTESPLRVHVLVEDEDDSSARALRQQPLDPRVHIHALGVSGKADKLNRWLQGSDADWIALLDADHVADPSWLRASLTTLALREDCVAVQGARRPLSLQRLPALWDSAQNHVGNECFDRARAAWGLPVFFTGTTAVFREGALSGGLGESLTEDTELSLRLYLEGERIAKLAEVGSREAVAPDIVSYCRRRRRWSAGHTAVFARRLTELPLALIPRGAFYLITLVVLLLLSVVSIHLLAQLKGPVLIVILLAALSLSVPLCRLVTGGLRIVDLLVVSAWTLPHLSLVAPWLLKWWGEEHAYFLVSFPWARQLDGAHLILAITPALFLIAAHALAPRLGWGRLALVVLTYPLMLWCDLVAITLGLVDAARGVREWPAIHRSSPSHARRALFVAAGLCTLTLVAVLVRDLDVAARCSPERSWVLPSGGPALSLDVRARRADDALVIEANASTTLLDGARFLFSIDGEPQGSWSKSPRLRAERALGWRSHRVSVSARAPDRVCHAGAAVSGAVLELDEGQLLVNGEPFVIKGVVPSFESARVGLARPEGFAQLRALGANTVRLYHPAGSALAEDAASAGLVVFDQPDESTWDNADVTKAGVAERLVDGLVAREVFRAQHPGVLLHLLGNELEIDGGDRPAQVARAIALARHRMPRAVFSYSTYYLYLDYDAPLLGINMLDSGLTYWRAGLDVVRARRRPFFASELGGFVAFSERPSSALSAFRLHAQWRALQNVGAAGAIVFQSHDNWAQPVPSGLNDAFSRDHPDDTRGLWLVDGTPSARVDVVAEIFADVEVTMADARLDADETTRVVQVRNVRPYRLRDLSLYWPSGALALESFELGPQEARSLRLKIPRQGRLDHLRARFSTHRGLRGEARIFTGLTRPSSTTPGVVGRGFVREEGAPLSGWSISGESVDVIVPPDWSAGTLRGVELAPGRHRVPLPPPVRPLVVERLSERGAMPFMPTADAGLVLARLKLPAPGDEAALVLDGLGANEVSFAAASAGPWRVIDAHPYRELHVPVASLPKDADGWTYLRVNRSAPPFIAPEHHPRGVAAEIVMARPYLFAPARVQLLRAGGPP